MNLRRIAGGDMAAAICVSKGLAGMSGSRAIRPKKSRARMDHLIFHAGSLTRSVGH
jgi:hypothetical protein